MILFIDAGAVYYIMATDLVTLLDSIQIVP